jgi:hypothetical protein
VVKFTAERPRNQWEEVVLTPAIDNVAQLMQVANCHNIIIV